MSQPAKFEILKSGRYKVLDNDTPTDWSLWIEQEPGKHSLLVCDLVSGGWADNVHARVIECHKVRTGGNHVA